MDHRRNLWSMNILDCRNAAVMSNDVMNYNVIMDCAINLPWFGMPPCEMSQDNIYDINEDITLTSSCTKQNTRFSIISY